MPAEGAALNTLFPTGEQPESRIPRILGYGLALICLVWVLRDFHVVQAMHQISNVDWKWVLLGMCFDVLSYGVQALRWECLLRPFGKVRLTRTIRAVFAGLFANLVFPLRPGEFLRSYLLSTSENISLGRVLGSLGVERLIDLVIATASLAIASLFVDLPRRFNRIADILGVVTLVVLAIICLLYTSGLIAAGGAVVHDGDRRVEGVHELRRAGTVRAMMGGLVDVDMAEHVGGAGQQLFLVPRKIAQINEAELAVLQQNSHARAILRIVIGGL